MLAVAFFALVMLVLVTIGIRRGFAREVASALAWSGAASVAVLSAPFLGPRVALAFGVSALLGYGLAFVLCWLPCHVAIVLVCRRAFGRLWHRSDADADDPDRTGLRVRAARTVDRLAGGAVGALKAAIVCGVIAYAGEVRLPLPASAAGVERVAREHLGGALDRLPEVRIARAVGALVRVTRVLDAHPERRAWLLDHPELEPLRAHPPIAQAIADPSLEAAVEHGRIREVLASRAVAEVLKDRATLALVADIDAPRIVRDVLRDAPPLWLFPVAPATDSSALHRVGNRVKGRVTYLEAAGAFVRVEPTDDATEAADGAIRLEDLSWTRRYSHADQHLTVGQEVEAIVLASAPGGLLTLGLKQATSDPWAFKIPERLRLGRRLEGRVLRVLPDEGAWVLLDGDLEGLVPLSAMTQLSPPGLVPGQTITVEVTRVAPRSQRIELSLPSR